MSGEPLKPVQLIIEFRPRRGVAIRQVDRGNDEALDPDLEVARLPVVLVARQAPPQLDRLLAELQRTK